LAVLMKIHANVRDPQGEFAHREYNIMREQFALDNVAGTNAYKEIFTKAHNLKRLALGFGVMFGGQCTGTLVINCTPTVSCDWLISNVLQTTLSPSTRALATLVTKHSCCPPAMLLCLSWPTPSHRSSSIEVDVSGS